MKTWRNILLTLSALTLMVGIAVTSSSGFEGRNDMICMFGCVLGVFLVGTLALLLLVLTRTRSTLPLPCRNESFLLLSLMFLGGIGLIAEAHTRYVCQKENLVISLGGDVVLLLDLAGGALICLAIILFVALLALKLCDKARGRKVVSP